MPTVTIYLDDKRYEFLMNIAKPNNPSSLGKAIIEEWIEKEKGVKKEK